jgi:hypothetical protein
MRRYTAIVRASAPILLRQGFDQYSYTQSKNPSFFRRNEKVEMITHDAKVPQLELETFLGFC